MIMCATFSCPKKLAVLAELAELMTEGTRMRPTAVIEARANHILYELEAQAQTGQNEIGHA
jgi:hypothetical protein